MQWNNFDILIDGFNHGFILALNGDYHRWVVEFFQNFAFHCWPPWMECLNMVTFNKFLSKYGKFCKKNPKISIVEFLIFFWVAKWQFPPPKNPLNSMIFKFFLFCKCWCLLCFFQNLLPKKSLYALFFLQFQRSRNGMNKIFKLSFSLQPTPSKRTKVISSKYFNSFSIFFHLINDLLTPSICRHGWQPYSQFQGSKDLLLYQHL